MEDNENMIPEENVPEKDDALNSELEDIRDMFQKELDEMSSKEEGSESFELPNGEVLIQSLDDLGLEVETGDDDHEFTVNNSEADDEETEEDDAEGEDEDEDLCQCCGEHRRDVSFGEDYPYCTECRNLMKRNPFNAVGVIVSLIILAVTGLGIGLFTAGIDTYSSVLDGINYLDQGQVQTAILSFEDSLGNADENSFPRAAVNGLIKSYAKLGYYGNSVQYINQYYTEKSLKLPWNKNINKINDESTVFTNTATYIQSDYFDVLNGDDFDYDKKMEKINKDIAENPEKADNAEDKYNQVLLEYVKYSIMLSHKDDNQELLDQLIQMQKVDEENGGNNSNLYISLLINAYAKMGDTENAKKIFEKGTEINSQNITLYVYYSDIYRYSLNKKSSKDEITEAANKILELAEESTKHYESSFSYPLYYRIYVMSYLLSGQYDLAKTNMDNYINEVGQGYIINDLYLYAFVCKLAGDTETYNSIASFLQNKGYSIPKSIEKFNVKKDSVVSILSDKDGEF